jgi:transketolase
MTVGTLSTEELTTLQGTLRLRVLDLYRQANAGHIGCSLSCLDLMIAALLVHKTESEVFLLSKGHAAAALYVCLHERGEITDEQLGTFYQNGTALSAHPAPGQFRSIPFATGSLGHGLPIGTGIAQANVLLGSDDLTYVLMSDGETNEGTTWEAAHYAVQNQLDRLIVLIDKNGLQGFGTTTETLGDSADPAKWRMLGFDVVEADGHDVPALVETIGQLRTRRDGRPKAIIATTVKGRGVSYMENRLEWHYLPMNAEQYEQAKAEVNERYLSK